MKIHAKQLGIYIAAASIVLSIYPGPIVRLAPNELIFSDPEAIKSIYGVNSGFTKSDFYHAFRAPVGRFPDHFSSDNQQIHAERRRIVNPVYSLHNVLEAEQYVDGCIDVLLEQLSDSADKKQCIDLHEWSRFFAYDTIGELFFSKTFGSLRSRHDHLGFMASADYLIPVMTLAALMPIYLRPVFMLTGMLFPSLRKAFRAVGTLTDASNRVVAERVQPGQSEVKSERSDFITKVLQIYREKGPKVDFDIDDVKTEAWSAFFGGGDTTAIYLSTTLLHSERPRDLHKSPKRDRPSQTGFCFFKPESNPVRVYRRM
ncbi:cytochrome P450 monooxygenase [Penicillium maclennaniae]|uniref:cytochrome P450 monooxygenase n=1 Tax=Penicillium maclennaniae TaxID=1343394 RepID=UPI0025411372|nr:cytochrome P450 monooxygenase [Penicillium maclennaniae]KAJ5661462.1 cytochrome P450 monooxygenase [Penicillium maclennaniae]